MMTMLKDRLPGQSKAGKYKSGKWEASDKVVSKVYFQSEIENAWNNSLKIKITSSDKFSIPMKLS